ncbi:Asp-tRNA(Asn)/Glu-tRNA(Gln) amidotransferase subunit GatB [Patescibacteria group bacterium]|nr:Asp-tRNA(Asn)/Glu-tRNA(Gln) amidotransferase subunit GatB [Patescibacteria group bacterium]
MNETDKENILGEYKLVLGLEIHAHAKTENKMFCGCSADIWKAEPNSHTCPTCLGLPGALPVPNLEAIKKTQKLGIALNCEINRDSRFDRKHYFYPDLPKGFQISQYKQPLCINGWLELDSGNNADIERIHLEEDTAKSFHKKGKTLIDFNKSGVPLIELVTRPCFTSAEDAVDFSKKFHTILRYLDVSDADMEKGQFRIEPNISLRTPEMEEKNELPNYKVEVKNINSFKFMEKAVRAEMKRQRELLDKGETPVQENRGYNEYTGKTDPQRSKEEAHDYRYFPEPDIPPMEFDTEYMEDLVKGLPELPGQIITRLTKTHGVPESIAKTLVEKFGKEYVSRFDSIVSLGLSGDKVASLLVNRKEYQELSSEEFKKRLEDDEKTIDTDLKPIVAEVLKENPQALRDYKKGKENAAQFLLGMVMRKTKGQANAAQVQELLLKEIKEQM